MDTIKDKEIITIQDNIQNEGLPESEDYISKISIDNDSPHLTKTIRVAYENTLIEQSIQNITNDKVTHETLKEDVCVNEQLSPTPDVSNQIIHISENTKKSDKGSTDKSTENDSETKLHIDNDIKSFLDDESSDMQDEEIQLRWDDDDDDVLNLDPEKSIPEDGTETESSAEGLVDLSVQQEMEIANSPDKAVETEKVKPESHDSVLDTSVQIKTAHGLKKPDMMLEIPTQELIDFMDDDDDGPELLGNLEMSPDVVAIEINEDMNDDIEIIEQASISELNTIASLEMNLRDIDVKPKVNKIHQVHLEINSQKETINTGIKISETQIGSIYKSQIDICLKTKSLQELTDFNQHQDKEKCVLEKEQIVIGVMEEPQPTTSEACIDKSQTDICLKTKSLQDITDFNQQQVNEKCVLEKVQTITGAMKEPQPSTPKACINKTQTNICLETKSLQDLSDFNQQHVKEKCVLGKEQTVIGVMEEPQPTTSEACINKSQTDICLKTKSLQDITDFNQQQVNEKCVLEKEQIVIGVMEEPQPTTSEACIDKSQTDICLETEALHDLSDSIRQQVKEKCFLENDQTITDVMEESQPSTSKACIDKSQTNICLETKSLQELSDFNQKQVKEKHIPEKERTITDVTKEPQPSTSKSCIDKGQKNICLETKSLQDLSDFNIQQVKDKCVLEKEQTITDVMEETPPSTSKACIDKSQTDICLERKSLQELTDFNQYQDEEKCILEKEQTIIDVMEEPQPSTSKACKITEMRRDSDEVGEVSDSLGLLAESNRVLEYDEEQDDDDDVDDDEDFEDEESSNQMIADYSEDSNAIQSESDLPKNIQMETNNAQNCAEKEQSKTTTLETKEFDEQHELQISDVKSQEVTSKNYCPDKEPKSCSDLPILTKSEIDAKVQEVTTDKTVPSEAIEKLLGYISEPQKLSDYSNELDKDNERKPNNLTVGDEQEAVIDASEQARQCDDQLQKQIKELDSRNDQSIVLLESSSEDDLLEVKKKTLFIPKQAETPITSEDVSTSSLLSETTEKCSSDSNSESKGNELETKPKITVKQMFKSSIMLEVFNVDSDDDDTQKTLDPLKYQEKFEISLEANKCVNSACESTYDAQYYVADAAVLTFYEADRKKKAVVCESCAGVVTKKNEELIEGIKTYMPLLELDTGKCKQDLVEIISDSESEDEEEVADEKKEKIGLAGAKLIEEKLSDMINETWEKFKMDSRLKDAQTILQQELNHLEKESKEIDDMLNDCQVATDKLRKELYATFEQDRKELPSIIIIDTPNNMCSCYEETPQDKTDTITLPVPTRTKRRLSTVSDSPAKKLSVLTAQSSEKESEQEDKPSPESPNKIDDDNLDVAVVKLSAETAPADLPQPGEITRSPLRVGMTVYAMRNTFGLWLEAKIVELQTKNTSSTPFTMCRVRFDHKINKNPFKLLPARCLAYSEPADVRLTIGTRIIAATEQGESFYSGVVAEVPNPVNNYRYLVFFDDGHAKYARHANTRLVCECSPLVWEEVHPYSRDFVRQYLLSYPERPMVRLHPKQNLKTEWNGKWWNSLVMEVDASLALIMLAGDRLEWIYRGSTRLAPLYLELQAAERHRSRPMPRSGPQHRTNMPYVEYTRYDEQSSKTPTSQTPQQNEEMRRQRSVAKKSTTSILPPPPAAPSTTATAGNLDNVTSRVVYYTPKNAVRPYKMTTHICGAKCKRTDVLALRDLRTYNPLAKPLLSGWERQIVRFKGHKEVMYRAPCGRRLRNMAELHRYLRAVRSDMPVDLFDFGPATHCLAEFVLNKCLVGKKDLSHGKENVPVPCVNYYDESLPEFCSYNTERTPTAGVPLNLDPEFLCGCDCEDDCEDKNKCACWQMTLEGARTIGLGGNVGYVYRRLPEPLPSGIYECNSRCKCKSTCLNRVAQHPLQLKLQVFKTLNRGWGIRALNDVPKGSFLCVYAGNLLTDATANLDGLNEGDEYLAELDYIEVVEQMKEGYEEDIPESLKEPDRRNSTKDYDEEEETSSEEEEVKLSKDEIDDDFQPGFYEASKIEFNKRLRTRDERRRRERKSIQNAAKEKEKQKEKEEAEKNNGDEDCITISDDEEVREPSRFTVQAGMDSNQLVSKYSSVRSYFGQDEACYIMDAKVQGNIGRYLNHSCCPNVFVQNVFVDTHDPRFPWVAFFALSHVRAGTELTWNYNYDVGSVPGKVLYCYCGAANCRGRLL